MSKYLPVIFSASALFLLGGCASEFNGYYLRNSFGFDTVCLVDNNSAPPSFFLFLKKALEDKGLTVKIVKKPSKDELVCPATIMYEARVAQKPCPSLKDARLFFLKKNEKTQIVAMKKPVNQVTLQDRMADSEPAVRDMVNRLLPRSTPW